MSDELTCNALLGRSSVKKMLMGRIVNDEKDLLTRALEQPSPITRDKLEAIWQKPLQ
jgi:hypothetical protein